MTPIKTKSENFSSIQIIQSNNKYKIHSRYVLLYYEIKKNKLLCIKYHFILLLYNFVLIRIDYTTFDKIIKFKKIRKTMPLIVLSMMKIILINETESNRIESKII